MSCRYKYRYKGTDRFTRLICGSMLIHKDDTTMFGGAGVTRGEFR